VTSEKWGEYVQVEIAGVPICIDITREGSPQQPNQIGVEVDDLQRTIDFLSGRGIPITKGSSTSEHWASVKDPDGHEIIFIAGS
jgi:catechol 2,3-dioxygenase-like lactoylglutathione lyase family enzyme